MRDEEERSFEPKACVLPDDLFKLLQRTEARRIAARATGIGVEEAELAYRGVEITIERLLREAR
jgi:hypothetical protein